MSKKGYESGSRNVFQDLGVPNADEHFVKAQLVFKIDTLMKRRGLKQIEAAHTNVLGPRGLGQKTTDFSAIPLCSGHHRENPDSYHRLGERWFAQVHQIRLPGLVQALNSHYRRQVSSPIDSFS